MSKIKINLTSGAVLEKPLITCFKGTNGNYVVLDNEANGSMGLPIIIISKLNGSNFEKIIDPNEWGTVKDNLKTIIGGTALPYLAVPETVNAPDDFFTQLTLPVASYDLLKNVYAPAVETTDETTEGAAPAPVETPAPAAVPTPEAAPAVPEPPAAPVVPAPIEVAPVAPVTPEVPAVTPAPAPTETPVIEAPVIAPVETPAPTPAPIAEPAAMPTPEVAPVPAAPVVPETPAVPVPEPAPAPVAAPEVPVTPVAAPTAEAPAIDLPVSAPADDTTSNSGNVDPDIALIKETFMKSCENMFDALIKKFQK